MISEEEFKDLYFTKNLNIREIAKIKGVIYSTFYSQVKKWDINWRTASSSRRKFDFNEDYFETIDTEDKAYFLGWLYSDGYVGIKTNTVSLASDDEEILNSFKKCLKLEKPIYSVIDKRSGVIHSKLNVVSEKIKSDLIKLGCVPRKSLILKYPTEKQVPFQLQHHFIRGYFDGDGSVGLYPQAKNKKLYLSIIGTYEFLNGVSEFLNINTKKKIYKKQNIFCLSYNHYDSLAFYNRVYNNSNFFLNRKKFIFESFIDINLTERPIIVTLASTDEIVGIYKNKRAIESELKSSYNLANRLLKSYEPNTRDFKMNYLYLGQNRSFLLN